MKPTRQQLESLVRLRGNEDFQRVMAMLKDYEEELKQQAATALPVAHVRRAQGGYNALQVVRHACFSAPDTLDKISKNPKEHA